MIAETADQIQELFIEAASIDRRLPNTARPAQIKSMSLPYVADWADMLGWGAERLEEERHEFYETLGRRLNPADVTLWEQASDMIRLVGNQNQRRALLHWAMAKAGGRPFAQWCRGEGILRETGRSRKNSAVLAILAAQSRVSGDHTHELEFSAILPKGPEISDKTSIIGQSRSWMAEGSRPLICDFDRSLVEFSWAEEQNARRRERDRRKREAA